ncbi:MAG: hypothetical protein ACK449_17770 [Planctomycetota bacterium]|jgi:hypothetical protein
MKRSTQVLLTLMLPAVAAFGCEAAKKPNVAQSSKCSGPAKPGEPPKTEFCEEPVKGQNTHVARTGSYFPWIWFWGSGSRSYGGNAGVQSAPVPSSGPMTSRPTGTAGLAPATRPAGAPSSVTSGGFGRTGTSFSSSS